MREAPGYEERSHYKPRHPSKMEVEAQVETAKPQPEPVIGEPPVTDEDTRPSVRVAPPSEPEVLSKVIESPDELSIAAEKPSVNESPFAPPQPSPAPIMEASEQPVEPVNDQPVQPIEQPTVEDTAKLTDDEVRQRMGELEEPVSPASPIATEVAYDDATAAREKPADEEVDIEPAKEKTGILVVDTPVQYASDLSTQIVGREPVSSEKPEKIDTREVSIFELFGLPKPSETQELAAVVHPMALPQTLPVPGRVGLRILLRRKLVKLRRPY
jgi:hypothetical protein